MTDATPSSNHMTPCTACGMLVHPGEYHPFAACLMFRACENSADVRANLETVLDHGREEMESANPTLAVETTVDPAAVLQWAVNSFGPIALNRDERAARMTEEAIEVAQVEGVPLEVIQRITERVYSRPVGELGQEIGGLMVGLYALAANCGVDFNAEFRREFARVLSKPRDWWQRKHAEKVAAGTADLSPTSSVKASPDPRGNWPLEVFKPLPEAEARGLRDYGVDDSSDSPENGTADAETSK